MKKRTGQKLFIFLLLAVLIVSVYGCAGDPSADGSDIHTIRVSLTILYPENADQKPIENYSMQVEENATVMQVLESYSSQEGVQIQVENASSPKVVAIGNVSADEHMMWRCMLNDTDVTTIISDQELKDGDEIVWSFVEA